MPIIDIQQRMREIGRIRTGIVVTPERGKARPAALETFRLTSSDRDLIDAAAAAFGGKPGPWMNGDQQEHEVITEQTALEVVIPRGMPVTQWNELWRAGGCIRRCDGRTNVLTMGPCECPADPAERNVLAANGEACKPTTRLSVLLPALPGLGVWRIESHGYFAAVELGGTADVLSAASEAGYMLPARLRLDKRKSKRPGSGAKHYVVPVLELPNTRILDIPLVAPGESGPADRLPPGRPAVPALPATTLPPTSDMRAPTPPEGSARPERPLTEPAPEVAHVPAPPAAAAAGPAPRAGALCNAASIHNDVDRCGLQPHAWPDKPHRSLDSRGKVTGTW